MLKSTTNFTIITAGIKGSGKTSFINTLVGKEITKPNISGICVYKLNFDTGDGRFRKIQIIDTPGLDGTNDFSIIYSVTDYIKVQMIEQIKEESKIRRNTNNEDNRVHILLYFIPSTGFGLKQKDIFYLKELAPLVNIIPVISKADGYKSEELFNVKALVKEQLSANEVKIFEFGKFEIVRQNINQNAFDTFVPFSIYNSIRGQNEENEISTSLNEKILSYTDLETLKEAIFFTYTEVFIDSTEKLIYEEFRTNYLEFNTSLNKK